MLKQFAQRMNVKQDKNCDLQNCSLYLEKVSSYLDVLSSLRSYTKQIPSAATGD